MCVPVQRCTTTKAPLDDVVEVESVDKLHGSVSRGEWDSDASEESSGVQSEVFHAGDWIKEAVCEVEEVDGVWRHCEIFSLKVSDRPGSEVCIYFGDDVYEGLPPNTYTLDKVSSLLYDSDGDQINIRNIIHMFKM